MLRYVTKSQYWEILDSGIMAGIPGTAKWHLKDIQDAVAYSYLFDKAGLCIAEIGAGHSRLLAPLANTNTCSAIDEYKGADGGPKSAPNLRNVQFIDRVIGNSEDRIPDDSFDIIFSVSVVEHIRNDQMPGFFSDCRRILKPNGVMIHLIDAYAEQLGGDNEQLWRRIQCYLQPFTEGLFQPAGEIQFGSVEDTAFRTTYATNPDNVMREWNRSAPALLDKRKRAQSCTLEMAGHRIPYS